MSSSNFQDTFLMLRQSSDEYIYSLFIPYEEIEPATNGFADSNMIAQGNIFKVYKGQFLHSGLIINIVARVCPKSHLEHFVNELDICKFLEHKNISSTFKITSPYPNLETLIIINKHAANGSLDKHLGSSTLTWMQRLKICLGVARALTYIHDDVIDDQYMIHGNIKSSKILLDDNWEPKLHGFGYCVRVKRNHGYFTSKYNGTLQYMDPAYENTKTLTYKSDVFSFGVVLFEVLFGKNASVSFPNEDHWYFAQLARLHCEERTLDDMIDPDLKEQMDLQSFSIFSETAYFCLKDLRADRPDMNQIVKRLESALALQQKHQTREHLTPAVGGTLSNHLKIVMLPGKNLDHLKIRLSDIELATNKFSTTTLIGSGGYGTVYKAELDHFDNTNISAIEGKNKAVFSKRRSTVAIKRLFSRQDGKVEEGFFAEIEMLTNCKHPNIVSLLGFCEEGRERILVYEHASNGSLNNYLGNIDNMTNFNWVQRIQICLDIANGLNYLHSCTKEKQMMIHRDIKSDNILLYDNWIAKIADFGLSKLRPANQKASTINTVNIAGTEVYLDPEYLKTGKLKKESDIYSFGVVLFEIICGRVAYDEIYYANNDIGLPSTIQRCFKEGTLQEIVDPKLKETHDNSCMLNGGLDQDSLNTFLAIAYKCLADTQAERPTGQVVVEELKKVLQLHKNSKDNLRISLEDIKQGTKNFSEDKCIGEGIYWKQYEVEISRANSKGCTTVVAKRFDSKSDEGYDQFLRELRVLFEHKNQNIVSLVGYCNEMDEKIIVYEHMSNGSLDKHLNYASLTWIQRLRICIDVANGLKFLHIERLIHRDIKSVNIVIADNWKVKISNLELTAGYLEIKETEHVNSSLSYMDPLYKKQGHLSYKSDIYSLGMVLLEMLSGRLASSFEESASDLIQKCKGSAEAFDEFVFEDIREHASPQSLTTFFELASACLDLDDDRRPRIRAVVIKLNKALTLQEDYEIWEPKLPTDYREIILMSNTPDIYLNESKKDLYDILTTKGFLLQQGKLWFALGDNGERNEMISATKFSYKNHWLRKWKSIPESRFQKVAQISDISNLKIQIKIKTQLLSPGVNYAVHLVFKFRTLKKSVANWMYVDLKYKMGSDNLHAYFARSREDGWMTIELWQFLNHKKDTNFEVLLESFSRCYRGSRVVYIEGVEFRAIENEKYEEIEKLENVQRFLQPSSSSDEVQQSLIDPQEILERFGNDEWGKKVIHSLISNDEQLLLLNEVNGKKHLMLSAIGVLYDSSKLKPFYLKLSAESRFQAVIELLPQQVFGIKYKIRCQMLSPDTEYMCYLVFKLSEKCRGLHCPVRVRNVLAWKNKEIGLVCFRPPSGPWNVLRDSVWVPKEREDGWMEVIVWKFNSTSQIRNDHIHMHLKLITYQGTMSGLVLSSLEIRSI